jgi:hypothetical protein
MIKKLLIILLPVLLVVLIVVGIIGHSWLKGKFEKEALVAQIEENCNCRAQIDRTSTSFLSFPAKVEIYGLKLAPRDADAAAKKPLGQRALLDEKAVLISIERVMLTVNSLMLKSLDVQQLHLFKLEVRTEVRDEGTSLQAILEKPKKSESEKQVTASAETDKNDTNTPPSQSKEKARNISSYLSIKPKALKADDAAMSNSTVQILNPKNGTRITLDITRFSLLGIDVIMDDLANHNQCGLEYEGTIRVEKLDGSPQTANFSIVGKGKLTPFDPATGEWDPDLVLEPTLKKGSLLGGLPLSQQLSEKDLKGMKDNGIDLGDIALGGVLGEDVSTVVHEVRGKLIVKKDTRLVFPQYEITLNDGTWFNAGEDAHIVRGSLIVGPELSTRILEQAKATANKKLGDGLGDLAVQALKATLMNSQGQLVLPLKSKGRMSKPEVSLDSKLNDAKDVLKDAGKSLLNGFLKK